MKNISYSVFLFLISSFIFCPLISAAEVKGLKEIYDTPIPAEIRRNFNEYIHMRGASLDPERGEGIVDGEKFLDIYARRFLVIKLEPNSFGGVLAVIAVEGETKRAFQLWLYDIGDGMYDLRSIAGISGCFDGQFVERLHTQACSRFWL